MKILTFKIATFSRSVTKARSGYKLRLVEKSAIKILMKIIVMTCQGLWSTMVREWRMGTIGL